VSGAREPAPAAAIAAVERDTGLSKDTLRIWERRYGFPRPVRDALGERIYPAEQVEKLRLLKRLMDSGHRPGKLVGLGLAELLELGQGLAQAAPPRPGVAAQYWKLLEAHDVGGVRRQLNQALVALGLERFVIEHVAPMNEAVGDGWMRGELTVAQEHVYTEALQMVLRQAIGSLPGGSSPRVLLATLPQEGHGLGLLMAEALLSLHGCHCISLGVKVPLQDLATAAALTEADIVALSFSAVFPTTQAASALHELRGLLPEGAAIWAGGSNPALHRRMLPGVESVRDIALIGPLVQRWRQAAIGSAP
jgi:methanogenic corrinoid protein MtbC1